VTACNGVVHFIAGLLKPASAPGAPSCGANVVGACTPAGSGSGSGLPKTGSESMALTYAALASLIAGAGVLVIRRRSIA
ncbi:MAG: LPXTG cell wall anchor domain-containing protein, partial [Actinomycetota bacterium]